ncbi:hypothetical protein FKM82_011588 [Ascaphus truei]
MICFWVSIVQEDSTLADWKSVGYIQYFFYNKTSSCCTKLQKNQTASFGWKRTVSTCVRPSNGFNILLQCIVVPSGSNGVNTLQM